MCFVIDNAFSSRGEYILDIKCSNLQKKKYWNFILCYKTGKPQIGGSVVTDFGAISTNSSLRPSPPSGYTTVGCFDQQSATSYAFGGNGYSGGNGISFGHKWTCLYEKKTVIDSFPQGGGRRNMIAGESEDEYQISPITGMLKL